MFTDDGEPSRRTAFSREIWRLTIAKVPAAPAANGMHDLRHYYASLLLRHDESVKVVQRRLGHATATETLDTYSHLRPDSDDRTYEALDAILTSAPPVWPESESGYRPHRSQAWGGRAGL